MASSRTVVVPSDEKDRPGLPGMPGDQRNIVALDVPFP